MKEKTMNKLYIKAHVEQRDKGIVAVASEEVEDRDGEIITIDGWDFKNFKKNNVLLWYHNIRPERSLPIGTVESLKVVGEGKKRQLIFEPRFEEITEFGRTVKRFYEEGYLSAFSVGFLPIEKEGNTYTKQELLEISAVPVPALATALVIQRAVDEGIDEKVAKAALGDEKALDEVIYQEDKENASEHNREAKAVVPYRGYTPAPESRSWDASAAKKRLKTWAGDSMNRYKQGFAWYDSQNEENVTAYKLPHHDVSEGDGLVTVWRGVAAAMAALLGARGGLDVSDSDRKGIYEHLKKHYQQFDKEVPEYRLVEEQVLKNLDDEIMAVSEDINIEALFKAIKNVKEVTKKEVRKKRDVNRDMLTILKAISDALDISLKGVNKKK